MRFPRVSVASTSTSYAPGGELARVEPVSEVEAVSTTVRRLVLSRPGRVHGVVPIVRRNRGANVHGGRPGLHGLSVANETPAQEGGRHRLVVPRAPEPRAGVVSDASTTRSTTPVSARPASARPARLEPEVAEDGARVVCEGPERARSQRIHVPAVAHLGEMHVPPGSLDVSDDRPVRDHPLPVANGGPDVPVLMLDAPVGAADGNHLGRNDSRWASPSSVA